MEFLMAGGVSIKNWLVLSVLALMAYLGADIIRPKAPPKAEVNISLKISEKASSALALAIIDHEKTILPNPVAQRQAFFLKKTILVCSIRQINTNDDKDAIKYISEVPWGGHSSEAVIKGSAYLAKYHRRCADDLIDQALANGPFAEQLAQAIKSLGFQLGPDYASVPGDWPESMSQQTYSSQLAKTTGYY